MLHDININYIEIGSLRFPNIISRYCNNFEITPSRSAWKVSINIPGQKVFERSDVGKKI